MRILIILVLITASTSFSQNVKIKDLYLLKNAMDIDLIHHYLVNYKGFQYEGTELIQPEDTTYTFFNKDNSIYARIYNRIVAGKNDKSVIITYFVTDKVEIDLFFNSLEKERYSFVSSPNGDKNRTWTYQSKGRIITIRLTNEIYQVTVF